MSTICHIVTCALQRALDFCSHAVTIVRDICLAQPRLLSKVVSCLLIIARIEAMFSRADPSRDRIGRDSGCRRSRSWRRRSGGSAPGQRPEAADCCLVVRIVLPFRSRANPAATKERGGVPQLWARLFAAFVVTIVQTCACFGRRVLCRVRVRAPLGAIAWPSPRGRCAKCAAVGRPCPQSGRRRWTRPTCRRAQSHGT
jgi:hypothetical protein